jgi:hypothetical protein
VVQLYGVHAAVVEVGLDAHANPAHALVHYAVQQIQLQQQLYEDAVMRKMRIRGLVRILPLESAKADNMTSIESRSNQKCYR